MKYSLPTNLECAVNIKRKCEVVFAYYYEGCGITRIK